MRVPGPVRRSKRDSFDQIEVEQYVHITPGRRTWRRRWVALDAPITCKMFRHPRGLAELHSQDGRLVCSYRWPDQ